LIPTFFVPLLLILHLISLSRVRKGLAWRSLRHQRFADAAGGFRQVFSVV